MRKAVLIALVVWLAPLAVMVPITAAQDKPAIQWQSGPTVGNLGDIAQLRVPEDYLFSGKEGAQEFLTLTENVPDGNELGVLMPKGTNDLWYATFEFEDTGYVTDDEKNNLDDNAILQSIEKTTEEANATMQSHGWSTLHVIGWKEPPFYNSNTQTLTWAVAAYSVDQKDGTRRADVTNFFFKVLGRRGVMDVRLVMSPNQASTVVPQFESILQGFYFLPGQKYADFRASDDPKANYGLTGLILGGGAVAVATKTGLLAGLWKFLVVIAAGFLATLKKMFRYLKRLLTGHASEEQPSK